MTRELDSCKWKAETIISLVLGHCLVFLGNRLINYPQLERQSLVRRDLSAGEVIEITGAGHGDEQRVMEE